MTTQLLDVRMTVNGRRCEVRVEPRRLLVDCLRLDLGLTGTHVGCETAQCGACVVLLNGEAVKSCNLLAAQADGATVVTIEGLSRDGSLHPVQQAFCEAHAVQCGFCTPGVILSACELLHDNPQPDENAIRLAIYGNLCRCTGYQNIVNAIGEAAHAHAGSGVAP